MVMFNFKSRFVMPIELGTKTQTIRSPRRRDARPGDALQLYTGPRFQPRKIGEARCTAAGAITLNLNTGQVFITWGAGSALRGVSIFRHGSDLDAFAVRDGFEDWDDLRQFWRETHDAERQFQGRIAVWDDTFRGGVSATT